MKCEKDCSKLNDFEILNFKQVGGNCMKGSIINHCKIPEKDSKPKQGIWSDWRTESICYYCGLENLKQQTRQCISKQESPPNRYINLKKAVSCQGMISRDKSQSLISFAGRSNQRENSASERFLHPSIYFKTSFHSNYIFTKMRPENGVLFLSGVFFLTPLSAHRYPYFGPYTS